MTGKDKKQLEKFADLQQALRTIRLEVQEAHKVGGSRAAHVGIDHIDHIAASALSHSVEYPTHTDLSDS